MATKGASGEESKDAAGAEESKGAAGAEESKDELCPICFDPTTIETRKLLVCCGNLACRKCGDRWMKESLTCPCCRADMTPANLLKLLLARAEKGNAEAQHSLACGYKKGQLVAAQDQGKAAQWFRKAAEQAHADAQFQLGHMLRKGQGVAQDHKAAARWYRKAAEQGHAVAQINLGAMYLDGQGVAQDEREAARWWRKAAEQGNADAQVNLGTLYNHGQGVAQDEREAARWWRKAAEQGHGDAQFNLGQCLLPSRADVPQDYGEVARWWRKAAEQGHVKAQYCLGSIMMVGVSHRTKRRRSGGSARLPPGDMNRRESNSRSTSR